MAKDHWPVIGHQWRLLRSPLRPCAEDVRIVEAVGAAWRTDHPGAPLRALLLGVTPELATLGWPPGTTLLALDRSEGMIEAVWPRTGLPPGACARCEDWLSPPLDDACIDLVAGDGALNALPSLRDHRALCLQLRRVLAAEGRFVVRIFVAPQTPESLASIEADLWAGRIGSFHVLKWRFLMSIQDPTDRSVRLADAWRTWQKFCGEPRELGARLGWAPETVATIDAYRDSSSSFTFPTLGEARAILSESFDEIACHHHAYELGERCPTLVLAPRTPAT
jgi:hypothetical protein